MIRQRRPSLRWRLILRLAAAEAVLLVAIVSLVLGALWAAGLLRDKGARFSSEAIAESLSRGPDGALRLTPTPRMQDLLRREPKLAFVISDPKGRQLAYGRLDPAMARAPRFLTDHPDVERADFWLDARSSDPQFHLETINTPAGRVRLLADVRTSLTFGELAVTIAAVTLIFTLPLAVVVSLIALWATSLVVRAAFRPLDEIVAMAETINVDERRVQLPDARAPAEIAPLIRAINDALGRLDAGYERQARFLADAAHELRTPIAIVQARIEGVADSQLADRLRRDVARLATLAEQLLDLQRMDHGLSIVQGVDLGQVGRRVAADLAPLVIAGGGEVELEQADSSPILGDPAAIERAVTNLVQNAVEHGGRRVIIRVQGLAVEVEDDGPGIPPDERERIFEPFHRLRSRTTGAGLGLNLVRQVMDRHGGRIEIGDAPDGGAVIRLEFKASPSV